MIKSGGKSNFAFSVPPRYRIPLESLTPLLHLIIDGFHFPERLWQSKKPYLIKDDMEKLAGARVRPAKMGRPSNERAELESLI